MTLSIKCADMGIDCSWTGSATNEQELLDMTEEHGKSVHGYTEEQVCDPEMQATLKSLIKEV